MASTHLVQSNITLPINQRGNRVVVDSRGRYYCAYGKTSPSPLLIMAYSDDGGQTWTEVDTPFPTALISVVIAIDSQDVIHVAYGRSTYIVHYRTFSNLAWNAAEAIFDGTSNTDTVNSVDIAVDSNDFPHVAWSQDEATATTDVIFYSERTSGSWASRTSLIVAGGSTNYNAPIMLIDSHNRKYIIFNSAGTYYYAKNSTGTWSSPNAIITISLASGYQAAAVIDSNDNVYVAAASSSFNSPTLDWVKYTQATDSWSAGVSLLSIACKNPSMSILSNNKVYLFYLDNSNPDTGLYYFTYESGAWSALPTLVLDDDSIEASTGAMGVATQTPIFPKLEAKSTQIPTVGFNFTFNNLLVGANDITFYSTDDLLLQVPLSKSYSRKASASLPSNDTNLTTLFNPEEYGDVAVEDAQYASQAATDQYAIQQFKCRATNSSDLIYAVWIGKTNIAPSASAVYLQIYNRNSGLWETLDSNNSANADVNFTLSGEKLTNLSHYYDATNWASFRVYQHAE